MRARFAAFAAAAALAAIAQPAWAGGAFDTPQEVGLPTDPGKLAIECTAVVVMLKGWSDAGKDVGFSSADIDRAGHGWVPVVYKMYRDNGQGDDAAEATVTDRVRSLEDGMRADEANIQTFVGQAMFCMNHPPA